MWGDGVVNEMVKSHPLALHFFKCYLNNYFTLLPVWGTVPSCTKNVLSKMPHCWKSEKWIHNERQRWILPQQIAFHKKVSPNVKLEVRNHARWWLDDISRTSSGIYVPKILLYRLILELLSTSGSAEEMRQYFERSRAQHSLVNPYNVQHYTYDVCFIHFQSSRFSAGSSPKFPICEKWIARLWD